MSTTPKKTIGKLTMTAPGDREIVLTRTFDAPRPRVFEALSRPELLKRWLGPRGWSLTVADIDARPGGAYRFEGRGAEGPEMGWGGVFREFVPGERFVATERFDQPWYPGEALITQSLAEHAGKTTLTATLRYESGAARDRVLDTRMEHGLAESYERLDELLAAASAEKGARPALNRTSPRKRSLR